PPPRARSSGNAASVVTTCERRLRSTASAKSVISTPSTEAGPGWPRWFQTKSSPPKAFAVSRTMRRALASPRWAGAGPAVLAPRGDDALGRAAGRGDLLAHRRDARRIHVDDADARALAGKADGAGAAHAGAGRGHDADLVLEPHGVFPLLSCARLHRELNI